MNQRDVRMRGFSDRTDVAEALKWVDAQAVPLGVETLNIQNVHQRVLAEEIIADLNVPSFARSAMDGFAVNGQETTGASNYNPLTFSIVGESLPGKPFTGIVKIGNAVRIMTGAPLPAATDAVVPAEYTTLSNQNVDITTAVSPGKHVSQIGEDIAQGAVLFTRGRVLRPQDVGVLASLGIAKVSVCSQPKVRLIITGNELAQPGQPRQNSQIYESNSFMLRGLIARDKGLLESVQFIEDNATAIEQAMTDPTADVVIVSGGSSVGEEDYAPVVLNRVGELAIHGIAMRPSSPTRLGRIDNRLVFLLPGNPVSCLCAYVFFARRAIRSMGGYPAGWPYRVERLPLNRKIVSAIGRVDYCRVKITTAGVTPLAVSGASNLASTSRADGFVLIPADLEGYPEGEEIEILHYDQTFIDLPL